MTTTTNDPFTGTDAVIAPADERRPGSARDRALATAVGSLRTAIGAGLLVAPGFAGRVWVGPHATGPGAHVFARAIGARDVVLGLQTLRAARSGTRTVGWLRMGALADGATALATVLAVRHLTPLRRVSMPLLALGVAVLGAAVTEEAAADDDD